jgi:hypothetical protein
LVQVDISISDLHGGPSQAAGKRTQTLPFSSGT